MPSFLSSSPGSLVRAFKNSPIPLTFQKDLLDFSLLFHAIFSELSLPSLLRSSDWCPYSLQFNSLRSSPCSFPSAERTAHLSQGKWSFPDSQRDRASLRTKFRPFSCPAVSWHVRPLFKLSRLLLISTIFFLSFCPGGFPWDYPSLPYVFFKTRPFCFPLVCFLFLEILWLSLSLTPGSVEVVSRRGLVALISLSPYQWFCTDTILWLSTLSPPCNLFSDPALSLWSSRIVETSWNF